ncbi:MAG: hypothetical protein U0836_24050 [Pirellulales bacterium]
MQDTSDPSTPTPSRGNPRQTADLLNAALSELALDSFSWRQRALLAHATGLLQGMAEGVIPCGQPRLRDDLLELVALFDTVPPAHAAGDRGPDHVSGITQQLLGLVGGAAAAGLTAAEVQLGPRQAARGRSSS